MTKRKTLEELSAILQDKNRFINENIAKVLMEDEETSVRVGVEIIQFMSTVDETYSQILEKKNGRRPKQNNLMTELPKFGVPEQMLEALSKVKSIRNWLSHSVDMKTTMFTVFPRNLKGLSKIVKLRTRLQYISNNTIEDLEYSYM